MSNTPNSAGQIVTARPVREVAGLTATDSAGRTVSVLPVRYVGAMGTTDEIGRPSDALAVVAAAGVSAVDDLGRTIDVMPVRTVAGLTTTNEIGQRVPVVPVYLVGGGGLPATYDASLVPPTASLAVAYNDFATMPRFNLDWFGGTDPAMGEVIRLRRSTDIHLASFTDTTATIVSPSTPLNFGLASVLDAEYYEWRRENGAHYGDWSNIVLHGVAVDATPDAFSFTDINSASLSTDYTSNAVTLTGFNQPVAITITGGTYAISTDGGSTYSAFTSAAGTGYPNDKIKVKQTSSGSNSVATNAVLTAGGVSDTYTVTTLAAPVSLPASGMTTRQDADAASTLYQTIDGSTTLVAADGDLVGYWGAGSGTGFHLAAAANNTTRPTWKANSGLPYVNFDATLSNILKRAAVLGLAGHAFTTAIAMRTNGLPSASNLVPFAEGRSSVSTNPIFAPLASVSGVDDVGTLFRNDSGVTYNISGLLDLDAFDGNDTVLIVTSDGTGNLICYEDGDTVGTAKPYTPSTTTVDVFAMGGLQRATASSWLSMRVYSFAAWNRILSGTELAQTRTYMGAKQGRLL